MKLERRMLTGLVEVRSAGNAPRTLAGYAAVFNREAIIAGLFREQIAPGAFTAAVDRDDCRCLFNHNPDLILGRTKARTLSLTQDATGLRYDAIPPDTQWARDLMVSIERGDVNQSSFGFEVVRDEWRKPEPGTTLPLRTILEARLFDVSPVSFASYEDTTAGVRL